MKISVCMATYNGEKYIKEQIESILCQINENDELIISDDGSTDKTISIIKDFSDDRIFIYENNGKHGFVGNFENALFHATGEFIFLSDQDDIWMPQKVTTMLEFLKKYDFVVSDCVTVDEKQRVISLSRIQDFKIKTGFIRLMIKTRYLGCCMAFNKKVLKAALPFPENDYYMEHDLWIASIAECYFKTFLINEPLIKYRRHGNNASSGGMTQGYSLKNKIARRWYRLECLWKIKRKVKLIKNDEI